METSAPGSATNAYLSAASVGRNRRPSPGNNLQLTRTLLRKAIALLLSPELARAVVADDPPCEAASRA